MTNKTELLPCPFCGSNEIKTVVDDGIHFEQCRKCDATGPIGFKRGDEDDVTWNTRAPAEDVRAVVEEPVGKVLSESEMGIGYDRKFGRVVWFAPLEPGLLYRHPQRPVEELNK